MTVLNTRPSKKGHRREALRVSMCPDGLFVFSFGKIEGQHISSLGSAFLPQEAHMPKWLYVSLQSPEGTMLWRDDLPYTILIGTQWPTNEEIRDAFCERIVERFGALGILPTDTSEDTEMR